MHLLKHFYEQKLIRKMLSKDLLMINIIRIDPEMRHRIQCACLVQSLAGNCSTSLHTDAISDIVVDMCRLCAIQETIIFL